MRQEPLQVKKGMMELLPDPAAPDSHGLAEEGNPYFPEPAVEGRRRRGARTGRTHFPRSVMAAVGAALIIGGTAGYLAAPQRRLPQAPMYREIPGAWAGQYAAPLGTSPSGALSAQASVPDSYSLLFTRRTNGVTIRAFLDGGSDTVFGSGATQGCPTGPPLVTEVSTSKMVGVTIDWGAPDADLYPASAAMRSDVLGTSEGDPIAVVVVESGPRVNEVSAQFSTSGGRSDSMSPVYGWAVLASPIAAVPNPPDTAIGRVESRGGNHKVLATLPLRANTPVVAWFGYAPACVLASPPSGGHG